MNTDQWSAVGLVLYVVIAAAVIIFMTLSFKTSDLRRDVADLRRALEPEVGTVQREIEYRGDRHDQDLERVLSDLRRSR